MNAAEQDEIDLIYETTIRMAMTEPCMPLNSLLLELAPTYDLAKTIVERVLELDVIKIEEADVHENLEYGACTGEVVLVKGSNENKCRRLGLIEELNTRATLKVHTPTNEVRVLYRWLIMSEFWGYAQSAGYRQNIGLYLSGRMCDMSKVLELDISLSEICFAIKKCLEMHKVQPSSKVGCHIEFTELLRTAINLTLQHKERFSYFPSCKKLVYPRQKNHLSYCFFHLYLGLESDWKESPLPFPLDTELSSLRK